MSDEFELSDQVDANVNYLWETLQDLKDYTHYARIGVELTELLRNAEMLTMHRLEDEYELFSAAVSPLGNPNAVRHIVRGDVLDLLVAARTGESISKRCRRCKQYKSISAFSRLRRKGVKDGRNFYCRKCEVERAQAHRRKKISGGQKPSAPIPPKPNPN